MYITHRLKQLTKERWTKEAQGYYEKLERDYEALKKRESQLLQACKLALKNLDKRTMTKQKWTVSDQEAWETLDIAINEAEAALNEKP